MSFQIDLNPTFAVTGETNFDDGPTLVWEADNLGDGDHQLWVSVDSLRKNGTSTVDYLEYVASLLHLVTRIVFQQDFCLQA